MHLVLAAQRARRFGALALLAACCVPTVHAEHLVVAAGATRTLSTAASPLHVDLLELGDGATLVLEPGTAWDIRADRARIGRGARIQADGVRGDPGAPGSDGRDGSPCEPGDSGDPGLPGGAGTAGAILHLDLNVETFGSLTVTARGGAGGDGGAGGHGGRAGDSDQCHGADGGAGGDGGPGGNGGDGGQVELVYRPLGDAGALVVGNDGSGLDVRVDAGSGGAGGTGGAGGRGGDGGFTKRATGRTLALNPGDAGSDGSNGDAGADGAAGTWQVRALPPRTRS